MRTSLLSLLLVMLTGLVVAGEGPTQSATVFGEEVCADDAGEMRQVLLKKLFDRYAAEQGIEVTGAEIDTYVSRAISIASISAKSHRRCISTDGPLEHAGHGACVVPLAWVEADRQGAKRLPSHATEQAAIR